MSQLHDLLNKSQKYAEAIIKEQGWSSYILKKDGVGFPKPDEEHEIYRVGLTINAGRVSDFLIG